MAQQDSVELLQAMTLERNHILQDIFDNIVPKFGEQHDEIDYTALKDQVLRPVIDRKFDPQVQLRGLLKAFRNTDAFKKAFGQIEDEALKSQINSFIAGRPVEDVIGDGGFEVAQHPSPRVKHHFSLLDHLKKFVLGLVDIDGHSKQLHLQSLPVVYEDQGRTKVMEVYSNVEFENWGQSVKNKPLYMFLPTTVLGVQNLVMYASSNNLRVRCAGYRHSWSPSFGEDNQILVSFVNLHEVTTLPDPISIEPGEYNAATIGELKTIELKEQLSETKRLCRVGTGVTEEEFRRWAVKNDAWCLPVDVILVEVTFGGVNAPICHGAGRAHKTISDYVRRVEYVDCTGKLSVVDDPYLIKAASGCFGLLGVVTHITFELDAMTYAVLEPRKVDIGLAIPPPSLEDIPKALRSDWFNTSDASAKVAAAQNDFERRATNDYYSEWFWFTYQRRAWVNTWNATTSKKDVVDYPDTNQTIIQWLQGWIGGVITSSWFFQELPSSWQAQILATTGMLALPPEYNEDEKPTMTTALPNALHFRRGVQNMRVRDMEFQIPLPPSKDDPKKPDFGIVQRAWWDVINLVYADKDTPMRLTLELRIMGGSDVIMAPQRGNDLGTVSIEVLSIPDAVNDDVWQGFLQQVADKWMSYGPDVNVRPHWAKEWDGLQLKGQNARTYLKEVAYKDEIKEFREALAKIGEKEGWTLKEMQNRFSNQLWDELVF